MLRRKQADEATPEARLKSAIVSEMPLGKIEDVAYLDGRMRILAGGASLVATSQVCVPAVGEPVTLIKTEDGRLYLYWPKADLYIRLAHNGA